MKAFEITMLVAGAAGAALIGGAIISYRREADKGAGATVPDGGQLLDVMISSGAAGTEDARVGDLITVIAPVGWSAPTADSAALTVAYPYADPSVNATVFRAAAVGTSRVTSSNGTDSASVDVAVT